MGILSVEKICFSYQKIGFQLNDISLNINDGEVLGFLGRNGAGKTTIMRIILGLIHPISGTVQFCGKRLNRSSFASIGVLIERGAIYPDLTSIENLRLHCGMRGLPFSSVSDVIHELNIDYGHKLVKSISAGMRQKLGLAIALLGRPKLLILDEPFSGLDPAVINESLMVLKNFSQGGGAILLSSHQLSDMQRIATSVSVLKDGAIVYTSTLAELEASSLLYIRCSNPERAAEILQRQGIDAGLKTPYVCVKRNSKEVDIMRILVLEDIFVDELRSEPLLDKFFVEE